MAENKKTWEYVEYEAMFGERLSQLRMLRNVSSRQMSLDLGQNEGYVNKIENGKILPSMDMFFRICNYLHVEAKVFFCFCTKDENILHFLDTFLLLPEDQQEHVAMLVEDLRERNEQKR